MYLIAIQILYAIMNPGPVHTILTLLLCNG